MLPETSGNGKFLSLSQLRCQRSPSGTSCHLPRTGGVCLTEGAFMRWRHPFTFNTFTLHLAGCIASPFFSAPVVCMPHSLYRNATIVHALFYRKHQPRHNATALKTSLHHFAVNVIFTTPWLVLVVLSERYGWQTTYASYTPGARGRVISIVWM